MGKLGPGSDIGVILFLEYAKNYETRRLPQSTKTPFQFIALGACYNFSLRGLAKSAYAVARPFLRVSVSVGPGYFSMALLSIYAFDARLCGPSRSWH